MIHPKKKRPVSMRQQQVIKLIMQEFSYSDMAGTLGISYDTVVTHIIRIKLRYLCKTEAGIVAHALGDGFTFNRTTHAVFYLGKVIPIP